MVVTRSKSAVKTLTKAKLGSLSSLIEKDGNDERSSMNTSRSIEMSLDTISSSTHQNGHDGNYNYERFTKMYSFPCKFKWYNS